MKHSDNDDDGGVTVKEGDEEKVHGRQPLSKKLGKKIDIPEAYY